MRLRGLGGDLAAILLAEVPQGLRLAVVVVALLLSHLLGVAWWFAGAHEREVVRAEVLGEATDLRNQVRHLWLAHEALRTRLDRADLGGDPRTGEAAHVLIWEGLAVQPGGPNPPGAPRGARGEEQ